MADQLLSMDCTMVYYCGSVAMHHVGQRGQGLIDGSEDGG